MKNTNSPVFLNEISFLFENQTVVLDTTYSSGCVLSEHDKELFRSGALNKGNKVSLTIKAPSYWPAHVLTIPAFGDFSYV